MLEELKKVLSKQLKVSPDKITLEAKIKDDLGADSLDILQLLMTMEEDYGIVIPDEELGTFSTVGDIVNFLDKNKK
ncbi:MAG: acyl carrier protein [Clostridiales bacterium]|nr:acyl carrier protein [Clostridiales bacterium]